MAKDVDVNDAQALQAAVAGHDVVLSAAHFSTLTPQAIIEPVKKAGVKRLLVVGGAGSLLLPYLRALSIRLPMQRRRASGLPG